MAEVISFADFRKIKREISRAEALAKGRIQYYTCDSCGEHMEVFNKEYPDICLGCGRRIVKWNNAADE